MYLLALILLISIKSCQKTELILFVKAVKVYPIKLPFSQFESRWLEHRPHFNIKNWRERERERRKRKKERKWLDSRMVFACFKWKYYLPTPVSLFNCSTRNQFRNHFRCDTLLEFQEIRIHSFSGSWNSSTAASWWSQWHQGIYYSKIMKSGWRLQVTWLVFANWSA